MRRLGRLASAVAGGGVGFGGVCGGDVGDGYGEASCEEEVGRNELYGINV